MISVIIPAYNRQDTIIKSINSVLKQTYRDIEVIVIDDASTDNTVKLLKSITDVRFSFYVHELNKGACAARNLGVLKAKGEYIAFHDSDDVCRPDRLEKQLDALKSHNADVTFCAMERHNYKNNSKFPNMDSGCKSFERILMGFYISTQTILGNKSVFEEFKFDESVKKMQDYDLMIRVGQHKKVYYLNEALVDVYMQSDSISIVQKSYDKLEKYAMNFLAKYPDIADKYPNWKAQMLKRIGHARVMQKKDSIEIYREIYKLEKTNVNLIMSYLCRLHLLRPVLGIKENIRGFRL